MSPKPIDHNILYYGDNLPILREQIADESVDLIYLDPPFNSSRSYNVLFRDESGASSDAQITAFDDTWHWGPSAEQAYFDIIQANPGVVDDLLAALRSIIGENQMMAYLVMMAARLVEMHRVLKPKGSLYLHCDPTASHYLKIILDTVFGGMNFRSEIIWKRTSAHGNASKNFGNLTDTILYYSKSSQYTFNQIFTEYSEKYLKNFYRHIDASGRRYRLSDLRNPSYRPNLIYEYKVYKPHPNGWAVSKEIMEKYDKEGRLYFPKNPEGRIQLINYLDKMPGMPVSSLWDDIPPISAAAAERLGYPTQKPFALLERIIQASSNPGDIIMDPFCGCGTAIAAAEKLERKWIGIDITYLAINLIENRMKNMYPNIHFEVIGKPQDIGSARNLAERDRYQFQWWALSLIGARPLGGMELGGKGKKGSDKGIDGIINYIDSANKESKQVFVQVKSGHVNSATIRDLRGVLQREHGEIGVLITLEQPSRDMVTEALSSGVYQSEFWGKSFPRVQIFNIDQLLAGEQVKMPPETGTFLAAQRVRKESGNQSKLDI
jgi:site-specific DNA-methyltransferase (adenine-specific)